MRVLGILLLVAGILAVAYGGFWYERDETKAEIGPVKVEVEERERVNIPLWAGVAAIVTGVVLIVLPRREA